MKGCASGAGFGVTRNRNGPVESYTYDAMGRLSSGGATYTAWGALATFNGVTREYTTLGQLAHMTKTGVHGGAEQPANHELDRCR